MKSLFLLMLCCLATGCASLPPPQSWNGSDLKGLDKVSVPERQDLYQKLSISKVDGSLAKMDGAWYEIPSLEEASSEIQADDARRAFKKAQSRKVMRLILPSATFLAFSAVGAMAKFGLALSSGEGGGGGNDTITQHIENDYPNSAVSPLGLAIGVGLGALVGGIEYFILSRSMSRNLDSGAGLYNDKLKAVLGLQIAPLPGGAKAGVDMRF